MWARGHKHILKMDSLFLWAIAIGSKGYVWVVTAIFWVVITSVRKFSGAAGTSPGAVWDLAVSVSALHAL